MKRILLLAILISISSCSLAPIHEEKTASTSGKDKMMLDAGYSPSLYGKGSYGLTENLDVAAAIEFQMFLLFSASLKYAVKNNKDGFSWAFMSGVFYGHDSVRTKGAYAGSILSHNFSGFEPYLALRYNYVKWNGLRGLDDDEEDNLIFDFAQNVSNLSFGYIQSTLGFNYWFKEDVGVNLSAKYLIFDESDLEDDAVLVPSIGMIFRI